MQFYLWFSWQASLRSSSSTETSSNVRRRSSIRRDSTASNQNKEEGEYNCDENNQNYLMSLDEFRVSQSEPVIGFKTVEWYCI